VWQQILNLLSAPSRGVFGGRAQLLIVDLTSHQPNILVGLVGNRDDAMKRIAIDKRPEIESACQQIWRQRVQVKYKFIPAIQPNQTAATPSVSPSPQNLAAPAAPNSSHNSASSTVNGTSSQTTGNLNGNNHNVTSGGNAPPHAPKPNSQPHNQPPPGPTPPPKNNPPANVPPSALSKNLSEEQLSEKNALDNLVRLFQGQVVDLEAIAAPEAEELSIDNLALEEAVLDN
jgi:hypothetical protein